jgi:hypothetical protein
MAAKKKSTTANSTATETLKFTKGAYHQDQQGELWSCANGKTKMVGDELVVKMQRTQDGYAIDEVAEEPVNAFVRQLTD